MSPHLNKLARVKEKYKKESNTTHHTRPQNPNSRTRTIPSNRAEIAHAINKKKRNLFET